MADLGMQSIALALSLPHHGFRNVILTCQSPAIVRAGWRTHGSRARFQLRCVLLRDMRAQNFCFGQLIVLC